ncbi:hypothetical protein Taro_010641 [Colocasia esculenta]|uniref:HhH-GPD domain-containing protein n=1 Tax=Colocasia esculenta TaxID=4460 RepID=A0A843U8S7_COLES|nr:hypothetical protein [Colocasia esculenta]
MQKQQRRRRRKTTTTTKRKRSRELELAIPDQILLPCPSEAPKSSNPAAGLPPPEAAYPEHALPTPEQCRAVRDDLLALHGFPEEFAAFRAARACRRGSGGADGVAPEDGAGVAGETVLDGLVATLLSQNTTDANSRRAFESLKCAFPSWQEVLAAEPKSVESAIRCGGLAATKAARIKGILKSVVEKRGELCLEYLRGMSVEGVKAELSRFKGIGPKTVACVLMFHLERDDFPVDTHVFRIAKAIGWVPVKADREKAYLHLNRRIPDDLKFDLNCLFVTHGKLCKSCSTKASELRKIPCESCPLTSVKDEPQFMSVNLQNALPWTSASGSRQVGFGDVQHQLLMVERIRVERNFMLKILQHM